MTTKKQDEPHDKKVGAASAQADAKVAKTNQDLETKELNETQLGDVDAGYNPEAMRWYMKQKKIK